MTFIVKPIVCDYAVCGEHGKIICICSIKRNAELIADILNGDYDNRCAYSYELYPNAKYKVTKSEKQMQEPKTEQFAKWVATEIFDDMREYNKESFAEIACRKLAKLGIVRAKGDEWELVEPQESDIEKRKPCINYEDGCEEWDGCPCVHYKAERGGKQC